MTTDAGKSPQSHDAAPRLGVRQVALYAAMRSAASGGDDLTFADVQELAGGCVNPTQRYLKASDTYRIVQGLIRRGLVERVGPLYFAKESA